MAHDGENFASPDTHDTMTSIAKACLQMMPVRLQCYPDVILTLLGYLKLVSLSACLDTALALSNWPLAGPYKDERLGGQTARECIVFMRL